MRRFVRPLVLGLSAMTLLAVLPAQAMAANVRTGWHPLTRVDTLYVRSGPNGFAIGTLFTTGAHIEHPHTDRFFVVDGHSHGGYVWGFAEGDANVCGWIASGNTLRPSQGGSLSACEPHGPTATGFASRLYLLDHYAYTTNDYGPGEVRSLKGRLISGGSRTTAMSRTSLFGNYDQRTGQFHDRYIDPALQVGKGDHVSWRYVTKDRKAVMVRFNGQWGFVPIGALRPGLSA